MDFFSAILPKIKKRKSPPTTIKRTNSYIKGVGNLSPKWISLNSKIDYLKAFYNCPPLFNVINYEAKCFSKMRFEHVKVLANGNEKKIKDSKLIKKLNNPNPLQTKEEFLIQNYIYWQIFGNSQIYNYAGIPNNSEYIINLWNLPTQYISMETTGQLWGAENLKDIIKSVRMDIIRHKFPIENLMLLNDSTINFYENQYIAGSSKMLSVNKNISNIIANLETQNVLLEKRGAIGILSNQATDDAGVIPMSNEQKEALQDNFQDYGMSGDKWQIIITDANLNWQQMSLPIRDMMLMEQYENDMREIANAYSFPIPLMNSFESAAGQANMSTFEKRLYSDKIIPDGQLLERELNNYFKLEEKSEKLKVLFDHIEVLQSDKEKNTNIAKSEIDVISKIQENISNGYIEFQTGINQLVEILQYSEEKAKKIINERINITETVAE